MTSIGTAPGHFAVPMEKLAFESVNNCLYCGSVLGSISTSSEDYFFRQVPGDFTFADCPACASLTLSPRLTDECLPLAYGSYYTHEAIAPDDAILGGNEPGLKEWLKRAYVRRRFGASTNPADLAGFALYRLMRRGTGETELYYRLSPPPPAKILDYGCGGGEYLRRMKALGHEVTGADFDPASLDRVRRSGIEAMRPEDLDARGLQGRFDLVTLAHVIEHVADPIALLRQLHGLTRRGGMLYLETPHAGAAGRELFGSYWRGLEAPRHLSIPSRAGLEAALRAAGYSDIAFHIRGSVRAWLWEESLAAVPEGERDAFREAIRTAPPETPENCEFITLTARAG